MSSLLRALVFTVLLTSVSNRSLAASPTPSAPDDRLNVLIITCDELRYDVLRFMQDRMAVYNGKTKVRTPNIDRLAAQSVVFTNVYAQALPCTPSRATLRTGCTIKRTGMDSNTLATTWKDNPSVAKRVYRTWTYDQVLSSVGYLSETFGKWHLPDRWFYNFDATTRAVTYDAYTYDFATPKFTGDLLTNDGYLQQIQYWKTTYGLPNGYKKGDQINPRSMYYYQPVQMSQRYGLQSLISGVDREDYVFGIDRLPFNYSQSAVIGQHALNSIKRLSAGNKPWIVTVSFENPHPPYVVTEEYASYYLANQNNILTPPNMLDKLENSYYTLQQSTYAARGCADATKVKSWAAVYYGMVEQTDVMVGKLLDELENQKVANKTLVIFTSDHGEFLGGHGLEGKFGLLEEALRVPLLIRLPGSVRVNRTIDMPVSNIDMFPTILDYLGYTSLDNSDGKSLRPFINNLSYRKYYEDEFVVSESIQGGSCAAFMVRLRRYKLYIARLASSTCRDLMFDIESDPYEMTNILPTSSTRVALIGKVEQMKRLLLEWMQRNDGGSEGYYSSSSYSTSPSRGDITEITARRSWPAVNQWVSDFVMPFGAPVFDDGKWRSNAWWYIGRTTSGTLTVKSISVTGTGKEYFSLSQTSATISGGASGFVRIKVAFASNTPVNTSSISASLVIQSSVYSSQVVSISWT